MGAAPDAFDSFAVLAREYCDFLEAAEGADPWAFVSRLQTLLPELYAAAIRLPYPERWPSKLEPTDHSPGPEECAALLKRLRKTLPSENYWTTLEPLAATEDEADPEVEVISACLSEDLADVYHDLAQGLRMLDRELPDERAQFLWKHNFMSHWGEKLTEALRILHVASFDLNRP